VGRKEGKCKISEGFMKNTSTAFLIRLQNKKKKREKKKNQKGRGSWEISPQSVRKLASIKTQKSDDLFVQSGEGEWGNFSFAIQRKAAQEKPSRD